MTKSILIPKAKLISLIFLIFSIVVAKSIYLILFLITLIILLGICLKLSVKEYVKFIRDITIILVIFLASYIIIIREYNIFNILVLICKILMIGILIKQFDSNNNFKELNEALYGILSIFRKKDIDNTCYDISMSLYLIKYFIESKQYIKERQLFYKKRIFGFKYSFFPRVIYTINALEELKFKLKANHYTMMPTKSNFKSKIVIIASFAFFVICIFKEVIL